MTDTTPAKKPVDIRLAALRRFAFAISCLTVLGHLVLGFEMAFAHPFVALATAYGLEAGLEAIDAYLNKRTPEFIGKGLSGFIDFFLPAHITALACAMLLYTNQTFAPLIFGVSVGICTKFVFRAPVGGGRTRHFLNPSNTGIAATLVVFPWTGVAPPYQFTEYVTGNWDWIVPVIVIVSGTFLNTKFTKKMPLIISWVLAFVAQAVIRGVFFDFRLAHALGAMSGMAFVLFTFYMISDPGTTPFKPRRQVLFGVSVAVVYAFMDFGNMVYQIFFALAIVCTARGVILHVMAFMEARSSSEAAGRAPVAAAHGMAQGAARSAVAPTD